MTTLLREGMNLELGRRREGFTKRIREKFSVELAARGVPLKDSVL